MNEPVAWMSTTGKNFVSEKAPSYVKRGINGWIPLYTHPVKELTDDEITECLNKSMDIKGVWGQPMLELNPVNFARAILRKAQEK